MWIHINNPFNQTLHPCYVTARQVRCRSPWFAVGSLVKSLDDSQDVDTPTAAAALGRAGGSGSWTADGLNPSGSGVAAVPPPPPPPRQGSIGGYALPTPVSYESELNMLFTGGTVWGEEPAWYYLDRSDQV